MSLRDCPVPVVVDWWGVGVYIGFAGVLSVRGSSFFRFVFPVTQNQKPLYWAFLRHFFLRETAETYALYGFQAMFLQGQNLVKAFLEPAQNRRG